MVPAMVSGGETGTRADIAALDRSTDRAVDRSTDLNWIASRAERKRAMIRSSPSWHVLDLRALPLLPLVSFVVGEAGKKLRLSFALVAGRMLQRLKANRDGSLELGTESCVTLPAALPIRAHAIARTLKCTRRTTDMNLYIR